MNNDSIAKLRVDRRLHRRRDWIGEDELQRELDALPDVAHKIRQADEDGATGFEAAPEASAPIADSATAPEGGGV
jgi:hypothetical protein